MKLIIFDNRIFKMIYSLLTLFALYYLTNDQMKVIFFNVLPHHF